MRPHPDPVARRAFRRLGPVMLLVVVTVAVVASPAGAVPPAPGAPGAPDPFTATPGVDLRLRYPLTMPVTGRVESLVGGGCPTARAHSGVDVSSPRGAPIEVHAVYPGVAHTVDTDDGYGLTVEIVHFGEGTRYLSRYAHLSAALLPPEGRWVDQGEVIGLTGASGNAQTVHLHFEVRDAADGLVDLNPAFRPCRRDVVAGAALPVDLPGLVSPAAVAVEALAPNTWALTGMVPGAPTVARRHVGVGTR